jgi:hypothetical protein
MSNVASLCESVRAACYRSLARCGFVRYERWSIDWPFDEHFHCWARVNVREADRHCEVEPMIGIHATHIERGWTALKVGRYRSVYRRSLATVACSLLPIAGLSRPLTIRAHEAGEQDVENLVDLYRDVGLAFAQGMAAYDALAPMLRQRVGALGGNPERLALCLHLLDRRDEAIAFVSEFARTRPAYFEGFAEPFLALAQDGQPTGG